MCGILGIYSDKNIYYSYAINLLKKLQHRGKDGYGISFIKNTIVTQKNIGNIKNINFQYEFLVKSCIGQTKYTTCKTMLKEKYIQPIESDNKFFSLVHNGNIPNLNEFDTGYIVKYIVNSKYENFESKLIDLMNNIFVSYSLVILTKNNELYAMRDRNGIRPLCIGYKDGVYIINSESYVFSQNEYIRDIKPGEIIKIDKNGIHSIYKHPNSKLCICSFELIYLMNENSITDNYNIKLLRKRLSIELARKSKNIILNNKKYIVIGIPSTGIYYGKCYANFLNLEYKQYIKKNTSERTFIHLEKNNIKNKCNNKFNYNEKIKNKNIIIVDDSIVRGNVIKSIIKNLKKIGANEIHVMIPSPPVVDICQLGISIDKKEELIMNNKTIEQVQKEIGCNSLKYLHLDDVIKIFPKKSYNQCFGGNNIYVKKNKLFKNLVC